MISCQNVPILTRFGSGLAVFIWTQSRAYCPRMVALIMATTFKSFHSLCPRVLESLDYSIRWVSFPSGSKLPW